MKTATSRKFFVTLAMATAVALPVTSQAASAVLPWDRTLTAMQDMLDGTVSPAAIVLAFNGAAILYALGGCDKQAGRVARSGIGGCIALAVVHLLNYLLP